MGLLDKFKKAKNQELISVNENGELVDVSVPIEIVPFEEYPEESALVEIKDNRIIGHINQAIPELLKAGTEIGKVAFGKKTQETAEVLYRAILPPGATLTQSRNTAGAVRGFYRDSKNIVGHADFFAVDNVNKAKGVLSNVTSSVMGIASMVVGQYYMEQINSELSKISDTIEQVANFQSNEYKSKIFALVSHIQEISSFQSDILENDDVRKEKIAKLEQREDDCLKLLGQANLSLIDFTKKNNLEFDKYEKELIEIQSWYNDQQTLLAVLYQISQLKYTLHLGAVSREQCKFYLSPYTKQTESANKQLQEWHQSYAKKFELNAEAKTRKHDGWIGKLMFLPGLLHHDFQICSVSDKTLELIAEQSAACDNPAKQPQADLFQKDVTLITKNGKVYYLPEIKT